MLTHTLRWALVAQLLLCFVNGLLPVPYAEPALVRRQTIAACEAPCGYWSNWYTQSCCGSEQVCITDSADQAKCGPRTTIVIIVSTAGEGSNATPTTVEKTILQTDTVTATQASRSSPTPTASSVVSPVSSTTASTEPTATAEGEAQGSNGWTTAKTAGVAVGGVGAAVAGAAALLFCWRRNRKQRNRAAGQRDRSRVSTNEGTESGMARVTDRVRTSAEVAELREEAKAQREDPKYDRDGDNPFSPEEIKRSRSQGFEGIAGGGGDGVSEIAVGESHSSAGYRNPHAVPRRPVSGRGMRGGAHDGIRDVPPPRMDLRPDHDPSSRR